MSKEKGSEKCEVAPASGGSGGAFDSGSNRPDWPGKFFVRLVIILMIGLAILSVVLYILSIHSTESLKYQAVFLSNGQVYFGHVVEETGNEVVLRDVFYLQIKRPLQSGSENVNSQENQVGVGSLNDQNMKLVKLGNELHGPEDEMRITREHILFVEDLKKNSKVAKAIERYNK